MKSEKPIAQVMIARPQWTIPSKDELLAADPAPPGRLVGFLSQHHAGLTLIKIEATWKNGQGAKVPGGNFQSFKIHGGGGGKTCAAEPEMMAHVIWERCWQEAERQGRRVTFLVIALGSDNENSPWEKRTRFDIDGTPDEEDDDSSAPDSEQFESDEAIDVEARDRPVPAPRDVPGDAMTPAMANAIARSPALQEMGLIKVVKEAYGGAMAEHRALATQVRIEQSQALRDMKVMFETSFNQLTQQNQAMVSFAMDQVERANARADQAEKNAAARVERAEGRVIELSRLDSAQFEGLMGMAQQGWSAFLDGLKMKADSIGLQQEYERAFLGMQIQGLQQGQRKSAAGSTFKQILPFFGQGLAAFLRSKGDEKSATGIEQLTMYITQQMHGGAVGGDPNAQHAAAPAAADVPAEAVAPLIQAVRNLLASLDQGQQVRLQQALPAAAWSLLLGAAQTNIEAACYACLRGMQGFLQSDPSLQATVFMALNPQQQGMLMQIVQAIAADPTAPSASPPPNGNGAAHAPSNGAPPSGNSEPSGGPRRPPPRPGAPTPPPA